jgi:hypothetical protein
LSFSNENGSASVRYATVTVFESRIFFQRVIALGMQQCGRDEKCDERGDANHDRFLPEVCRRILHAAMQRLLLVLPVARGAASAAVQRSGGGPPCPYRRLPLPR